MDLPTSTLEHAAVALVTSPTRKGVCYVSLYLLRNGVFTVHLVSGYAYDGSEPFWTGELSLKDGNYRIQVDSWASVATSLVLRGQVRI